MAVRFGCSIFTYDTILDQAGVLMDDEHKKTDTGLATVTSDDSRGQGKEDLKSLSSDALDSLLKEVLEQEDYIKAIAIRDEIKKRGK